MEQEMCLIDDSDNDIIDARDINDHELQVMEGDLVGNTAYSAKWILETMLTLYKVNDNPENELSDDVETNFCLLWDMTTEKDVVCYLMKHDFLVVAEYTLKNLENHRLKEIILGIIGNMCSQPDALLHIVKMNDLIEIILNHLISPDTEILIQVLRILHAAMWDIQWNDSSKWRKILVQCKLLEPSLTFILENSTNESLLTGALCLLQSIATTKSNDNSWFLNELFEVQALLKALKSSFTQLISSTEEDYTEKERGIINNWLDIVSNLLQKQQSELHTVNHLEIVNILFVILQREENNLFPLEETKAQCIYKCIESIHWYQQKSHKINWKDVSIIFIIMEKLNSALMINIDDEIIKELVRYIERYWLKLIEQYKINDISELFEYCPRETKEYLINVTRDNGSVDLVCKLVDIQII